MSMLIATGVSDLCTAARELLRSLGCHEERVHF